MNKIPVRAVAWILLLLLAMSCVVPAFAADTTAHTVTTQLGDGLTLSQLNSLTGSTRRQQFTLDYDPDGTVQPIIAYGDTLYGKSTVEQVVQYAQDQGHHVLAAVNTDYFSTSTGVPVGMTILDGRLVTSDGGWNAIGFLEDGKAIVGHPELSITLTTEDGETYPIHALNNVRTADGLYLYTPDFDYCTRTSAEGTEVLLDVSGSLKPGKKLKATVLSVANTKNTEMQEGQMVLSLTANNKLGLDLAAILTEGDEITLRPATADERWEEVVWASGGGNILVKDGAVTADATASGREPRTVLGVRKDGTAVIVECDGRQSSISAGMTLAEAAQLLLSQGCTDVINLDGGGSSIIAAAYPGLDSAVISSPSDGAPRAGATYLLFIAKGSDQGRTYGSVVYPRSAVILTGSELEVSAVSYNKNFLGFLDSSDKLESTDGWVEDGVFLAPDYPCEVVLSTGSKNCQTARITVTDTIHSLKITRNGHAISSLTLDRRESVQLDALASDGLREILCDKSQFTWSVEGNIGTVDEKGHFTAGSYTGSGSVTLSFGDTWVSIPVTVAGKTSALLEGFESGQGCGTWGSGLSTAEVTSDLTQVRYGKHALRLTYSGGELDASEYLFTDALTLDDVTHLTLSAKGTGTWEALFLQEDGGVSQAGFTMSGEGWRNATVTVPQGAVSLLGFVCQGAGSHTLLLDQLAVHYGALNPDDLPPALELTLSDSGLTAVLSDKGELPLTKANLTLTVDGRPADFTFQNGTVTAALPQDGSLHRITLTATDLFGNITRKSLDTGSLEPSFADMRGHWAASHAQYLLQKGVFSPADRFNPGTKVSNEMAATMLSRYLGVDTGLYEGVTLPYGDTKKISSWALPHVKAMYALGIMRGSVDTKGNPMLYPQNNCSRAQIMTILGRTLERGYTYAPCTFADSGKIPAWARDHIDLLTSLGVITGGDGGKVNPLGTITRAEFAALLYRMY